MQPRISRSRRRDGRHACAHRQDKRAAAARMSQGTHDHDTFVWPCANGSRTSKPLHRAHRSSGRGVTHPPGLSTQKPPLTRVRNSKSDIARESMFSVHLSHLLLASLRSLPASPPCEDAPGLPPARHGKTRVPLYAEQISPRRLVHSGSS